MQADTSIAKPYKGLGMEGAIARWYAALKCGRNLRSK